MDVEVDGGQHAAVLPFEPAPDGAESVQRRETREVREPDVRPTRGPLLRDGGLDGAGAHLERHHRVVGDRFPYPADRLLTEVRGGSGGAALVERGVRELAGAQRLELGARLIRRAAGIRDDPGGAR